MATSQNDDNDSEIEALVRERTEEARQTWLSRHPVRFAGAITADDVSEIVVLLAELGVPPTQRAVREVYGGGSPNVITPLMRNAWVHKEVPRRLATLETGQAVPPRLLQFWDMLLSDATTEAKLGLAKQQRAIDDTRAGLDAQMETLIQRERVLDERLSGMQAQLQMTEASAGELRGSLAERTRERDALKAEVAQLRDQLHTEVRQLRERLDIAESASADARERLAVREGELATARIETNSQARRADEAKSLADQARADATAASERANRLVLERAQLDLDLADVRTRLNQETTRGDTLEKEHAGASEALEALRKEHAELRVVFERRSTDLVQLQNSLAQARASITVHEHVEGELRRTREELQTVMRDRDQMLRNPPALLLRLEAIETLLERIVPAQDHPKPF